MVNWMTYSYINLWQWKARSLQCPSMKLKKMCCDELQKKSNYRSTSHYGVLQTSLAIDGRFLKLPIWETNYAVKLPIWETNYAEEG
ncbi:hypothetical protein Dimus_031525 [Dionaea muscipula]